MSRCFPYPPPGYTLSRASNEALIESIKLQKEREKSKSERKKEKKEKKKDRKEKKKAKEEKAKQIKAHLEHDLYRGESLKFVEGEFPQKERKDDTEQLERSSITEEHEQPICSQNPSYSSDSTQNSNKRKRQSSPINGTRVLGNILRIRLPSQKHIKHDIRDDEEKLCSTSGRIDVPAEHKNDVAVARADPDKSYSTSSMAADLVHGLPLRSDQESTQPNDAKQPGTYLENVNTDSGSKRDKKLKRVVARYRELIENWTPASVPRETADNDNDEDWLFGRNREVDRSEKMPRVSTEMTCSSSASLWPRAHYLPDVDIYALPYTIPF